MRTASMDPSKMHFDNIDQMFLEARRASIRDVRQMAQLQYGNGVAAAYDDAIECAADLRREARPAIRCRGLAHRLECRLQIAALSRVQNKSRRAFNLQLHVRTLPRN